MPAITIYIADRGTERANGEPATVGHMWYSLDDGKGKIKHFSFYQDINVVPEDASGFKKLFTPGYFSNTDGEKYINPGYSRTIKLNQDQYEAVNKFSEDPESAGFRRDYNAFTNSCIDFVWAALHAAGLNQTAFEGDLWPWHNKDNVENIGHGPVQGVPMWQVDPISGLPWPFTETATDSAARNKRSGPGISNAGAESARAATRNEFIDPLALDLDGDGIETEGSQAAPLFDHNGDAIRTGTGWLKPDDGWLVLDRDGNGSIDSGKELFGVNTVKKNGLLARDGFDALADFDANGDHQIDASDDVFARLRVWRDLNQDAISQADELTSLDAQQIKAIRLQAVNQNQWLDNGNRLSASATFSRLDGSEGTVSNLDLATDTFQRIFTTSIDRSDDAAFLPELRGAGRVRNLAEAISLSPDLTRIVQTYVALSERQQQIDLLDEFIERWADTSEMKSLRHQAGEHAAHGVTLQYRLNGIQDNTNEYSDFLKKLGVVERFMGFTYRGGQVSTENITGDERNLSINFSVRQIEEITTAYERFKSDIYESLLPMTRLSKYYFALCNGSVNSDFTELEDAFAEAIKTEKLIGVMDVLEFTSGISRTRLAHTGWDYHRFLTSQLRNSTHQVGQRIAFGNFSTQLAGVDERALTGSQSHDVLVANQGNSRLDGGDGNDILISGSGNDRLVGDAGNDTLDGGSGNDHLEGGAGNDQLLGADGNDILYGGEGDDRLDGGNGNDNLQGGRGNDTLKGGQGNDYLNDQDGDDVYLFDRGDGSDTIQNSYYQRPRIDNDTILFGSTIAPSDIAIVRTDSNDLVLKVNDADDSITVKQYFTSDCNTAFAVENIRFADGTTWGIDTVKKMALSATDADDSLRGYDTDDVIQGKAGNDWLRGAGGDDLLDGGAGNDFLDGGTGNDTYLFNRGSNADVISHARHGAIEFDTVLFGDDISEDHIWLRRAGNDLELQLLETDDKLTVRHWYSGNAYRIDAFQLQNGKRLLAGQVDSMVGSFANLLPPGSRITDLSADQKLTLAAAAGANWR